MDKVMPREIDENMKNLIDTYGDRIESVKDYISGVRKLPGMYNSKIGTGGFLNLIRECGQNCCDQIIDKNSPGSHFSLYYNENTREVKVEDDGMGIPFKDIIRVFTTPHTSKNFEKKLGDYSAGAHGQGAKVANALSKVFIVESYRYDGTAVRQEFHQGYPITKEPVPIPNKQCKQGTSIYFIPDEEVMGDMDLHWQSVFSLFRIIICFCPPGAYMDFTAVDKAGQTIKEKVVNKDGILGELKYKIKVPLVKPILITYDTGEYALDCAICFNTGDKDDINPEPDITAFANYCPVLVEGSTSVQGTIDGICKWFANDMNNFVLVNQKSKDKLKIIPADIKNGLCVVLHAKCLNAVFGGQSKQTITNEELVPFCRQTIMDGLTEWAKSNPGDLGKLRKFFKDMGDLRTKQDKEKVKIVQKFEASDVTGGLPTKYVRPTDKNCKPELIIVEGDSALGTAELARDPKTQGLFPIRGKIINAFQCSRQKFFENEEVQAITRIILDKRGYRRNFTIDEVQVSKVIFMADADIDGAHISALLLRMFVMYFPQMITAGMVYKAVPPLFSIKSGNKDKYFTDQRDLTNYMQKIFLQKYKFGNEKGIDLTSKEVNVFLNRNVDYVYFMDDISNTYSVDPYLFEMVLFHYLSNNRKIDIKKLQKEVKSKYRFMDVYQDKKTGLVEVSGTIKESNIVLITDKLIDDCSTILKIMDNNDKFYYTLNGNKVSIYQVMKTYEAMRPSNISRFKGLGEMDKDQLKESTIHPGYDRTLIRYTMEDAKEELEAIREYENNSKKILSLVTTVTRDELSE